MCINGGKLKKNEKKLRKKNKLQANSMFVVLASSLLAWLCFVNEGGGMCICMLMYARICAFWDVHMYAYVYTHMCIYAGMHVCK